MSQARGALVPRMMGAAKLDIATYEEVEHDTAATGQAAMVVVMVALARAIGESGGGIGAALVAAVAAFVGWGIWAGVTYLVGTKVFDGTATWGELLRTLGFAQAPGILFVLGILPLTGLVLWIVPIWMLVTGFVGVRQALDVGNGATVLTILVGFGAYVAVAMAAAVGSGILAAIASIF